MKKISVIISVTISLLFVSGCNKDETLISEENSQISSTIELKAATRKILSIPLINQLDDAGLGYDINKLMCGPTCLAMYLNYRGISVTKEQIYEFLNGIKDPYDPKGKLTLFHTVHNPNGYYGVNDVGMMFAASEYYSGNTLSFQNWTAEMIVTAINEGSPVIVDVWANGSAQVYPGGTTEHFVLIKGYDLNARTFLINNPWGGKAQWVLQSVLMDACTRDKKAPYHTNPATITGPDNLNAWGMKLF